MNGLREISDEPEPQSTAAPKSSGPAPKPKPKKGTKAQPLLSPAPTLQVRVFLVMLAVTDGEPMVCLEQDGAGTDDALPAAAFIPGEHQSLEQPLADKNWLDGRQFPSPLQQIDCRLAPSAVAAHEQIIDITYLALRPPDKVKQPRAASRKEPAANRKWQSIFVYLPWEDWRQGRPQIMETLIRPHLTAWARLGRPSRQRGASVQLQSQRQNRVAELFSNDPASWEQDKTVERFQLMVDAGLLADELPGEPGIPLTSNDPRLGQVMTAGNRRRLAIALGALRQAVRQRPDVRGLMPPEFTLFDLQRCVEIILGPSLHKQNFRRQVETQGLLEPTGRVNPNTGGRPAQLYRFRRDRLSH